MLDGSGRVINQYNTATIMLELRHFTHSGSPLKNSKQQLIVIDTNAITLARRGIARCCCHC